LLNVVLPVGISFYTFQTMSYSIDIYRGDMRATRSFFNFAVFVAFFPQLVAGPIERATRLLGQVEHPRRVTAGMFYEGSWLILLGFFQKVFIADNLGVMVDQVFSQEEPPTGLLVWLGLYAFAFQIYGDFAGYSNIARGVSRLMGFEIVRNFASPYLAQTPSEFIYFQF